MSKFNDFMLQWGTDKFLHFMGGAAVYGITESWIVMLIVSFGKELYDVYFATSGWSNKDALATMLGGLFTFVGMIIWEFVTAKLPFVIY